MLLTKFTVDLADLNGRYQAGIVEQNPGWEYDIFPCVLGQNSMAANLLILPGMTRQKVSD